MDSFPSRQDPVGADKGWFRTTNWAIVLSAAEGETEEATAALEELCRTYWPALYSYVRQRRYSTHDAEDLTQEFFARFLAKGSLGRVRREKGRFRSYMLSSFKYFLADMRDFRCRQKRGGEERPLSIDVQSGEGWYDLEPTDHVDPSTLFDHRWALVLLAKVLDRLRAEYERADRLPLFHCLKEFLIADKPPVSYADLALELNMSEGAIRVAVHRLRRRYGELFLREVANTVSDPNDISEEARHLLEALKISDAMGGVRSG